METKLKFINIPYHIGQINGLSDSIKKRLDSKDYKAIYELNKRIDDIANLIFENIKHT